MISMKIFLQSHQNLKMKLKRTKMGIIEGNSVIHPSTEVSIYLKMLPGIKLKQNIKMEL